MEKLSIVVLTYNSDRYLDEVLRSATFADEVLILDSGSTDETLTIARRYNIRVEHHQWSGFGRQKQKAVELASNDWVFVLDSDEVILPPLQKEILETLENPKHQGYMVPRLNYFFGRPIRHGGLYPDTTLRLFDKRLGRFTPDEVHERVVVEGNIATLRSPMKHYAYESVEQFVAKQSRYASLGARPNRIKAIVNPFWTFVRMYLLKAGFLDGWEGFVIARLYSQYTFWKYTYSRRSTLS